MNSLNYIVGITGASGSIYGVRLVEALLADPARRVDLIVSPAGARVAAGEIGKTPKLSPFDPQSLFTLTEEQAGRLTHHAFSDIGGGPASGTFKRAAMIVCPASVKTVAAIAAGLADNLITRAADVTLKEGRPMMIVPRETPFSLIHLRNMTTIAEAGGIVLPANPAFYHRPATIDDLVRYVIQKIFDRLDIPFPNPIRWE